MSTDVRTVNSLSPRERNRPLRVVVSAVERAQIEASARGCGLSVSAFLRALGLGHTPKSDIDRRSILDLMRLTAELGRLGGLLKLSLAEVGEGPDAGVRRGLYKEIEAMKAELRGKIRLIDDRAGKSES